MSNEIRTTQKTPIYDIDESFFPEGEFTKEERTVGKLILLRKMRLGLEARADFYMGNSFSHKLSVEETDDLNGFRSETNKSSQKIASVENDTYKKVAALLGIPEERYIELKDYVYEKERII
jgi:hypothetical protein